MDDVKWLWKGEFKYHEKEDKYYALIKELNFDKEIVDVRF